MPLIAFIFDELESSLFGVGWWETMLFDSMGRRACLWALGLLLNITACISLIFQVAFLEILTLESNQCTQNRCSLNCNTIPSFCLWWTCLLLFLYMLLYSVVFVAAATKYHKTQCYFNIFTVLQTKNKGHHQQTFDIPIKSITTLHSKCGPIRKT